MRSIKDCVITSMVLVVAGGAAASQEIKTWTLVSGGWEQFYTEAEQAFEEANPGVDIVTEFFPNEGYKTQLQVALTGSQPPDVFFSWAGEDAARLVEAGLAADISEYAGMEGGFGQYLSEGVTETYAYGGGIYGVPIEFIGKYFYYDPEFFEAHGLKPAETFADLLQLCRDIRAVDANLVPWPLGNSERWMVNHLITILNQRMVGLEASRADYSLQAPAEELYTEPGYVAAWQKVLDLQKAGCFQDAPNATSPQAGWSMFAAQVSPMNLSVSNAVGIYADEGYEDFEIFDFPVVEDGKGDNEGEFAVPQGVMVSSASENQELAAKWASFLVSDEMAMRYAELTGGIVTNPARIDEAEVPEVTRVMAEDLAATSEPIMVLDVLLEASVANAYLDAGVEVLNGTMTPDEAMASIREAAVAAKGQSGGTSEAE